MKPKLRRQGNPIEDAEIFEEFCEMEKERSLTKPRQQEWWINPNWSTNDDSIYGVETSGYIHVVEYSALSAAESRVSELEALNAELLANIPKVPSEPNEKRLAKRVVELESECVKLRAENEQLRIAVNKATDQIIPERDELRALVDRIENCIVCSPIADARELVDTVFIMIETWKAGRK